MAKRLPDHIGEAGRVWIKKVLKIFQFSDPEMDLLYVAGAALDRLQEIREQIKVEGLTIKDRFDQDKAHPLLSIERDNRLVFSRICNQLQIVEQEGDGGKKKSK